MNENKRAVMFGLIVVIVIVAIILKMVSKMPDFETDLFEDSQGTFKIISSTENKDLENILNEYAKANNIDLEIEYEGTLDIMNKLNSSSQDYDAVWASNSIWLYMLNRDVKVRDAKSTSINPVIFAVKESKAKELGFVDREIYTSDIVKAIQDGDLKFSMSNPTQTNTGATAYLGLLSSLAGSPEVLKQEDIENVELKDSMINLFSGMVRSSGSESFLEELLLKNDSYEAVVTYESSIIDINKKLEKENKEILYALYPIDGVSISDSPFGYIDNNDKGKKEIFDKIQEFILSQEGQNKLAKTGRRTWFGGVNNNVDKSIFNPNWGIDTTKYLVPIKFPNAVIIEKALGMYQTELRKPIHTVFALDYSGSMSGEGEDQLKDAMEYILDKEKASKDFLQFTDKDKITVIPFSSSVIDVWTCENGNDTERLIYDIKELDPHGGTNLYDTSIKALEELKTEDLIHYNVSIILMTDGLSNNGTYSELSRKYRNLGLDIPIYSIMFGDADATELEDIAELTNAKVFDGRVDLLKAFKEVRGYN